MGCGRFAPIHPNPNFLVVFVAELCSFYGYAMVALIRSGTVLQKGLHHLFSSEEVLCFQYYLIVYAATWLTLLLSADFWCAGRWPSSVPAVCRRPSSFLVTRWRSCSRPRYGPPMVSMSTFVPAPPISTFAPAYCPFLCFLFSFCSIFASFLAFDPVKLIVIPLYFSLSVRALLSSFTRWSGGWLVFELP